MEQNAAWINNKISVAHRLKNRDYHKKRGIPNNQRETRSDKLVRHEDSHSILSILILHNNNILIFVKYSISAEYNTSTHRE